MTAKAGSNPRLSDWLNGMVDGCCLTTAVLFGIVAHGKPEADPLCGLFWALSALLCVLGFVFVIGDIKEMKA